jgi:hypothetical protein
MLEEHRLLPQLILPWHGASSNTAMGRAATFFGALARLPGTDREIEH